MFKEALEKSTKKRYTSSTGEVSSIDDLTCTVKRQSLPDLLDVRLQAVDVAQDNYFLIEPAIGSKVVCLRFDDEDSEACIVKTSNVKKIKMIVDGAVIELESGKIKLKNDETSIKSILNSLFTELQSAVIQTPAGPGNFAPDHVTKFQELNNKVNQILS